MKLHEIIETNEDAKSEILIETLAKYAKSLMVYYKNQFPSEPILMVTSVFNACQYAKIVPADELSDAFEAYYEGPEEEKEQAQEVIFFQSFPLNQLIK